MDHVKEYTKTYIKQNTFIILNPDKISIIASYGHHKIFYSSDFICHVDTHDNTWSTKFNKSIVDYNNLVKKKITFCILCITNDDDFMIEYVVNSLNRLQYLKIILVAKNNLFLNIAIRLNIDYIISSKHDYKGMIHNGLTYIKNSDIKNTKIFITNTETLINTNALSQALTKLTHTYTLIGPARMKFVDISNNINVHTITTINNIFIPNWFLITTNILNAPIWNIFGTNIDLISSLESYINKTSPMPKIMKVLDTTAVCFNYDKNIKIKQVSNPIHYDKMEYDLLNNFLINATGPKYKNLIEYAKLISIYTETIPQTSIQIVNETKHDMITTNDKTFKNTYLVRPDFGNSQLDNKPNSTQSNKLNIDKVYFINNFLTKSEMLVKINKIQNIHSFKYSIIDGNKNRIVGHVTAIKDAMTRNFKKIVIIEDKLICNEIFILLNRRESYPSSCVLLLLVSSDITNSIINLQTENHVLSQIRFFTYYLNSIVFKDMLNLLGVYNNLHKTITELQTKSPGIGNIYAIYDNFNISNLIISKPNKFLRQNGNEEVILNAPVTWNNKELKHANAKNQLQKQNELTPRTPFIRNMKELRRNPTINQPEHNEIIPRTPFIRSLASLQIESKSNTQFQGRAELIPHTPLIKNMNDLRMNIPIKHSDKLNATSFAIKSNSSNVSHQIAMPDTNKIVQSLWIGESLSLNEVLCVMSFIRNNHEFHLYTYEPVKNIPKECIVKDANEIIPSSEIFYYDEKQSISGQKRPTGFSNMFRYKMLFDKGGYWVDMDMICVKPLKFNDLYVFSSESTFSREQTINAGIIKCPKGSEFAKYCYMVCKVKDKTKLKWGEIGPRLVAEGVTKYNLNSYVKPWHYFCPIGYDKINDLIIPTKLQIGKDWYCIHLWNEFWVKKNWDKNKIYYGSLFGSLVNKYCRNYLTHDIFNLELQYGKINKSCVLYYWIPKDDDMIHEMETLLNTDIRRTYDINTFYINKEHGTADNKRIENFIKTDIYIFMFKKLLDMGFIDNLHIIIGVAPNNKYVYNNAPLFDNGNVYTYNNNIHLWKLNDIKSLFSFANAKLYFYKGYGHLESFYSMMKMLSPSSIFVRYLATALPFCVKGTEIVIDDNWVQTYARNNVCKNTISNFNEFFKKDYTNYDLVYVDTEEKIPNYKIVFPNTKTFMKFNKYSLMAIGNDTIKRDYDLIFCCSDVHPSKNWPVFYRMLSYYEQNKKELRLLIITPVVSKNDMVKYTRFKYIHTTVKRSLTSTEMCEYYNKCRTMFVCFSRDSSPRVIPEALSCGVYVIVLDILSDGGDIIKNNQTFGKMITVNPRNISFEPSYNSKTCSLTDTQYNDIYALIKKEYDHKLIAKTFMDIRNADKTIDELHRYLRTLELNKRRLVVSLATEDYSNNLNRLLASISHTNSDKMVLVYCVNWRDTLIDQFRKVYPFYCFEKLDIGEYVKGDILKLKVTKQYDTYFKLKMPYVFIDADSVVLKSLNWFYEKIKTSTLLCYHRPEKEENYLQFAAAVIAYGINNNKEKQQVNEQFIKQYYENSKKNTGENGWFQDQISLNDTYLHFKNNNNFMLTPLTEKEHAINGNYEDTIVYSRRLTNKKNLDDILQMNRIIVPYIDFDDIKMKYD